MILLQKDLYKLFVKTATLIDSTSSLGKNFSINLEKLVLDEVNFEVYRDKNVKDDPSIRSFFSEKLRGVPFPLLVKKCGS